MLVWDVNNLAIEPLIVDGILLLTEIVVGHEERGNERDTRQADGGDCDVPVHNRVGAHAALANGVAEAVFLERLDVTVYLGNHAARNTGHLLVHLVNHLLRPDASRNGAANAGSQGRPQGYDGNKRGHIVVGDGGLDTDAGIDHIEGGKTKDKLYSHEASYILSYSPAWLDQETIAKDFGSSSKNHETFVAMRDMVDQTDDRSNQTQAYSGNTKEDSLLIGSLIFDNEDV